MKLSDINGDLRPQDIIGKWVHTKVPFYIQWEASTKCRKGAPLTKPFNYGADVAFVCSAVEERARLDTNTTGNWTVTCFFPTVVGGNGGIGMQTAENLNALVKIYK